MGQFGTRASFRRALGMAIRGDTHVGGCCGLRAWDLVSRAHGVDRGHDSQPGRAIHMGARTYIYVPSHLRLLTLRSRALRFSRCIHCGVSSWEPAAITSEWIFLSLVPQEVQRNSPQDGLQNEGVQLVHLARSRVVHGPLRLRCLCLQRPTELEKLDRILRQPKSQHHWGDQHRLYSRCCGSWFLHGTYILDIYHHSLPSECLY
jgi:hypothetical protein